VSQDNLTLEEKATNFETLKHIQLVQKLLHNMAAELLTRAEKHDQSKLEHPEVEAFTEFTNKLSTSTYGSQEYEGFRKAMKPALDHHYANNRHHPEHFKGGIHDMNLLDLIEMFCDWKAATTRHRDGNLRRSIEVNASRYGLSPQLVKILENTVELVDK
jgi:hypothetical protein